MKGKQERKAKALKKYEQWLKGEKNRMKNSWKKGRKNK